MAIKKNLNLRNEPYILDMNPGRYAWCSCGASQKQPFCDGSHESVGLFPIYVEITEPKKIAWCACKGSDKKPFCDGTHKHLNKTQS